MKKLTNLCILICLSLFCRAQQYTVTHITGKIYYQGHLLKTKDKVDTIEKAWSSERSAELGLLSLHGRRFVTFTNGKAVKSPIPNVNSELYELIIEKFLKSYTTEKIAATKGVYDFVRFFRDTAVDSRMRIMIIQDEYLPLSSALLKFYPGDKFFLCILKGNDTIGFPVKKTGDGLTFDQSLAKKLGANGPEAVAVLLKLTYSVNGSKKVQYFPHVIQLSMPRKEELQPIIDAFSAQLAGFYQHDSERMFDDLRKELFHVYGRFYEDDIRRFLERGVEPK